jgi:D-arabinose 1-dehydrogenase-like Zn-dependent alcohol dehydrogenase
MKALGLIATLITGILADVHQIRDEWGRGIFPMVPGHEIVGKVVQVGGRVEKWCVGDTVGVGCFVDSCRACEACKAGEEQYCERGPVPTYNSYERDGKTPTCGGYSTRITVDENHLQQRRGTFEREASPHSMTTIHISTCCAATALWFLWDCHRVPCPSPPAFWCRAAADWLGQI